MAIYYLKNACTLRLLASNYYLRSFYQPGFGFPASSVRTLLRRFPAPVEQATGARANLLYLCEHPYSWQAFVHESFKVGGRGKNKKRDRKYRGQTADGKKAA